LRGQGRVEALAHFTQYAVALLGRTQFIRPTLLLENITAQAQFSAQRNRLLNERALLAPIEVAASDLLARFVARDLPECRSRSERS
jgi:hypothetical protein